MSIYIFVAVLIFTITTSYAKIPVHSFSWYSTIRELKDLAVLDTELLDTLREHVKQGGVRLVKMRNKIAEMKKFESKIGHEYVKLSNDEITGRVVDDLTKLQKSSRFALNSKLHGIYVSGRHRFPGINDFFSVLEALLELQMTYKLNATDLVNGYVLGKYSGSQISMSACEYLVESSCNKSTDLCKEWVDVVLTRIDSGESSQYTNEDVKRLLEERIVETEFKNICASSLIEKAPSNRLQCHMWNNYNHPWLVLQPVAMEILSENPPVARFFNVISDKDIIFLKSLAMSKLAAAQTFARETSFTVDSYRVAHNCWLSKRNNTVLQRMDGFVSAITGLQVARASEQLQIANYGIAGHYLAHTDQTEYDELEEMETLNRKATFMFYLSDVERGGATAFVYPRIAVKPIKGSAVFWHNLLPSGMGDMRTVHGSCSVLSGDKWVANKWIWETRKEVCKLSEYIGRIH